MTITSSRGQTYRIYYDSMKHIYFLSKGKKSGSRFKESAGVPQGYKVKETKSGFVYLKKNA